jgi:hypothetical protein
MVCCSIVYELRVRAGGLFPRYGEALPEKFCAEKKASFVAKDPLASSHRENGLKLADLDIHGGAA